MKNKILFGIFALLMGLFVTSCNDNDDYSIATDAMLTDGSVVTGSSDVTATTAIMHATVKGLEGASTSSYVTGFLYGSSADALTKDVSANIDSAFSATITGQTENTVIYYQAYVTLQGRLTYKGAVKQLVTTDATATTGATSELGWNKVTFAGSISKYPSGVTSGIVLSTESSEEAVRAGLVIPASELKDNFSILKKGLLPNTTYYYATYLNLGSGIVYGEVKSFTTPAHEYTVDDDFVDLGLSVKWAKANVGAESESDFGGLFAFGDMTGCKNTIYPADYASKDVYKTANDIAYKAYGSIATMPTAQEFEELFSDCKKEWTTVNGVSGYKLTGPNGNSIFMPAAGSRVQNTISGEGVEGRYLTGSVNVNDSRYAMSYIFNNATDAKTTTPVYQALAVRAVSTARNVKFNKSMLYNTWEIDMKDDGKSITFAGPVYFYGYDDSWASVTNNQPVVGNSWSWLADATQTWAFDGPTGCRGSMKIWNNNGKDSVCVVKIDKNGVSTSAVGALTIDSVKKTMTSDVDLLAPTNFVDPTVKNRKTTIKILSQGEKKLQLGFYRDSDPATLSVNYIPQLEKYGYTASLTCYGASTTGQDQSDAWSSATITIPGSSVGTYTVTFNTKEPRSNGKVFVLDLKGFAAANPNAFVRVDSIVADGKSVPFDQNKFYFGDIEGKGNYRIEMANIWGCGHNEGWDGLADTPFHPGGGATKNETALAFNSTFSVTFTVVAMEANLDFSVKQTAIGLNAGWSMPGNWGKENPAAIKVKYNAATHRYELQNKDDISLKLTADECDKGVAPSNGAVNLIDVVGIRNYFPGFSMQLISVNNDNVSVPFVASNILYGDIEKKGNFRVELHNIWGAGTAKNPAFGGSTTVEGNNCVTSLGFTSSSVYTIGNFSTNLFPLPW